MTLKRVLTRVDLLPSRKTMTAQESSSIAPSGVAV